MNHICFGNARERESQSQDIRYQSVKQTCFDFPFGNSILDRLVMTMRAGWTVSISTDSIAYGDILLYDMR